MRVKGLTTVATVGFLILISAGGCGEKHRQVVLDRASIGGSVRQVKWNYHGFKVKFVLPTVFVQAKGELTKNSDLYLRAEAIQGALDDRYGILKWRAIGNFEAVAAGLNYFPFETRAIGLDIGMQMFRGEYEVWGRMWPIKHTVSDHFCGGGVNLGLAGGIPFLVWNLGYNWAETDEHRLDLDGWYATLGVQFELN